jgi:hypothetical protein
MTFPSIEPSARPKSGPRGFRKWVSAARVRRPGTERGAQTPDRDGNAVDTVIGATSTKTTVTLHSLNPLEPTSTVILGPNRYGQLPTVLVDPIDVTGQVACGMWLGDGCDGTTYELTRRHGED